MKKAIVGTLLCGSILMGAMTTGMTVLAAGGSYETGAQVLFEENDEPTTPVDPEEPETPVIPIDPIDPETPVTPGTPGPLSIDFASSLNFGKQKITSVDKTYFAAPQKITHPELGEIERENYVQVTDGRGTLEGWQLSVKQDGQFKTAEGKELKGAKITFLNAQLETNSEAPQPSTLVESFDLTADGTGAASNVFAAKKGEAAGTWIYRFGDSATQNESVKLEVPGSSTKYKDQAYKAAITWSLTDVPGNGGGEEEGNEV